MADVDGACAADAGAVVCIDQFRPAVELQALCRIAGLPHRVVNSRYPAYASTGELPQLRCGSVLVGGQRAAAWMRERYAAQLEGHLSPADVSTATVLLDVVHGTLFDVAQWCAFAQGDAAAAASGASVQSLAARQMAAPLSWVVPRHMRDRALATLAARGFLDAAWVRQEAVAVYRALEAQLSRSPGACFFGGAPSPLDAAVFAHLDAVRRDAAGAWVAAAAPGLLSFFRAFHERVFGDGAPAGGALLTRVGGCANAFEAWADAWEARWRRRAAARAGAAAAHAGAARGAAAATGEDAGLHAAPHFGPDAGAAAGAALDVRRAGAAPLRDAAATVGVLAIGALAVRLLLQEV